MENHPRVAEVSNFSCDELLLLLCSAWRWWLPTHTKQEQERMFEAALTTHASDAAMGTEFAVL